MDAADLRASIPATERCTYLNTGATGPSPRQVVDATADFEERLQYEAPCGEGPYEVALGAKESARESVAGFLGADPTEVALTRNTVEGVNVVANGFDWESGDVVVRTDLEHPAGRLPWDRLAREQGVEVRVLEVEEKTIDGRDGETDILSGIFADETARLPFTDWDPHDAIEADASIRIEDAFVREFRGVPSVNVSEFSTVTTLDRAVEATADAPQLAVRDAIDRGGLFDVELVGNVIAVRDGSGLIERCPDCGRVVQNGQCRSHGAVEGVDDLRVKAILDDGTGTVTAILDDDLTAEIYGGGVEAAKEHARDEMDQEAVADAIRETIVGREFRVRGSLSVDEYGANLNARSFAETEDDPAERASALLAEVGR